MKKIKRTNEMMVKDLMNFSPYGALGQVFIVEAIRYYAEQVSSQPRPDDNPHQFINPQAWHDIANDVKKRLDDNYEAQE